MNQESTIRARIESWAQAVNECNYDGILAWHHKDIVMYDVPPPFQSIGIEAYRKTLELFFSNSHSFRIVDLHIVAGGDAAFCYAPMKCVYFDEKLQREIDLDFRLTIGFRKIDGEWWFVHEHHSVAAE